MKTYRFFWLDGTSELGQGNSVSEAFNSLGYSRGALAALDYYEEVTE